MASRVFVARELFNLREVGVLAALLNSGFTCVPLAVDVALSPDNSRFCANNQAFAWNTMLSGEI